MQYETKHTKYAQINRNKSTHSEMGPVRQVPNQRTLRTVANDAATNDLKHSGITMGWTGWGNSRGPECRGPRVPDNL